MNRDAFVKIMTDAKMYDLTQDCSIFTPPWPGEKSLEVHFFKRVTGKGFIDHLNDWRISRACTLLTETDTPIQAICRQTGFHNVSHFNRQFRDRRGASPRDFRKAQQKS